MSDTESTPSTLSKKSKERNGKKDKTKNSAKATIVKNTKKEHVSEKSAKDAHEIVLQSDSDSSDNEASKVKKNSVNSKDAGSSGGTPIKKKPEVSSQKVSKEKDTSESLESKKQDLFEEFIKLVPNKIKKELEKVSLEGKIIYPENSYFETKKDYHDYLLMVNLLHPLIAKGNAKINQNLQLIITAAISLLKINQLSQKNSKTTMSVTDIYLGINNTKTLLQEYSLIPGAFSITDKDQVICCAIIAYFDYLVVLLDLPPQQPPSQPSN